MGVTEMSSGNQTGDAELTQANFDTNMVIILAALLCALICALGLNSMARCVLRCTRRLGIETAEQAAARVAATGLKKSALRKIPVVVYGSENDGSGPGSECPICLGEFVDGEKVRVLPNCNHGFHVRCIDTWLGSHSSCPNCRHSLLEPVSSTVARGAGDGAGPPYLGVESGGGGGRQEHVVIEVNAET
uniref:RING-type E3 ubiquitin transferase n=1 Tax=Opuntia streptacantha TaxID=393608 RepID=A0A7C8ZFD3_OPUST